MEKYEELKSKLVNIGDTGTMQCFGESMLPIIKSGSVLTFRKEETYEVGDIVFCEVKTVLSREQKIRWLIKNCLMTINSTQSDFERLYGELIGIDVLGDVTYKGNTYKIPNTINSFIDAHMVLKVEDNQYLIGAVNTEYGVNGWTDTIHGRVISSYVKDDELYFNSIRVYGDMTLNIYWPQSKNRNTSKLKLDKANETLERLGVPKEN